MVHAEAQGSPSPIDATLVVDVAIEAIEATRLPAITPGPGTRATAGRRPLVAVVRSAEVGEFGSLSYSSARY